MSNKLLVGYDGSDVSRRALDLALTQAKLTGASLMIAHVLEWSPYSFLTQEEIEERHKRRNDELERAHTVVLNPVLDAVKESGVAVDGVVKYGQIADVICKLAEEEGASQIYIGRHGQGSLSVRVFGSVAGKLAQTAPVACTIVP
ncbi:universal stress protein [Coralliovum pocilloporae]|uniref:universal stress protein n=1 Tax=Coralliovum pocilloporae TaxID=3066369 RepID=UPI003306FF3C